MHVQESPTIISGQLWGTCVRRMLCSTALRRWSASSLLAMLRWVRPPCVSSHERVAGAGKRQICRTSLLEELPIPGSPKTVSSERSQPCSPGSGVQRCRERDEGVKDSFGTKF